MKLISFIGNFFNILDSENYFISLIKYRVSGIFVVGDFNHMKDKSIKNFPLKQIVKSLIHVSSILDCIYTNIDQYYKTPDLSLVLDYS